MARLAVFIDIENFAGYCADMGVPVDIAPVLEHLSQHHGRIQIKRSFGDVSSLPGPAFNPYRIRRMLQAHQIDHLDIPHRPTSYSKNSADIRLVVEAVALIHERPEITHIVVVSNDRDFIPLFNHAREHGKLVIGCGPRRANVNEDYRNACDVFVFHEDLVSLPAPAVVPTQPASTSPVPAAKPVVSTLALTAAPDAPGQPAGQEPSPAQPEAVVAPVAEPRQPGAEATEESEPHPVALISDQAWQPSSYFAAPPVPEPTDAPLPSPLPLRVATEGDQPKAAGQDEPIDCLLAALRTIQAEGGLPMASRVAVRMKELFPHFDVKKVFGSFKQFCIEQEKSGFIVLSNRDQANFTLAIPPQQHQPETHPNVDVEAERHLLAKYREWSFQKLKIPFPSPAVRTRFYDILVQVLDDRPLRMDTLPLQELSRLCSIPLAEVTANPTDVAFRLCYGLYRGKAFRFYRTDSTFNPDIIGLAVEPHALEECIVNNTRASFIYDSQNHGLPLDETTLARLMQGSAAVVPDPLPPAETPAAPAAAPAWEPTLEPLPPPVTEAAPVLPMPTETVTVTEPDPAQEPVQEPAPEFEQPAEEQPTESVSIAQPIPQPITQSPDQPVEPPVDQLAHPGPSEIPTADPVLVEVFAEIAPAPETPSPQPEAKPSLTRKPRTTRTASSTKAIKASTLPQDQSDQSGQPVQADALPADLLTEQAVVPDTGPLTLPAPEPDKASKPKRSSARKKSAPPAPPEDSLWN
jgi:hypothetical protein